MARSKFITVRANEAELEKLAELAVYLKLSKSCLIRNLLANLEAEICSKLIDNAKNSPSVEKARVFTLTT